MFFSSSQLPGQYLRFFAKRPSPSGSGEVVGGIIRHPVAYNRILSNLSSWNIYLGMNPATTWQGIKVRDDQIAEAIGLVVDIDPRPSAGPALRAVEPALRAIESTLGRVPFTTVVATGRGLQLWLRVHPHRLGGAEDRYAWRAATRTFLLSASEAFAAADAASGYRIDTSCSDLSRLIRAPHSINQRTGTRVEVLETHELPPINPSTFLEMFTPTKELEPPTTPRHQSLKWWKSFHLLTTTAKRFIVEGVGEPGRHAAAYAAAASLRDTGISVLIAERLVLHGAARCSPPLGFEDALRACHNAYRAASRQGGTVFGPAQNHIPSVSA